MLIGFFVSHTLYTQYVKREAVRSSWTVGNVNPGAWKGSGSSVCLQRGNLEKAS